MQQSLTASGTNRLIFFWLALTLLSIVIGAATKYGLPADLAAQIQGQLREMVIGLGGLIWTSIAGSKLENTSRNLGIGTPPPHELAWTPPSQGTPTNAH